MPCRLAWPNPPLAPRSVPHPPAPRRCRAVHRQMPRRPARTRRDRWAAVAQRPRHRDQARAPLVAVRAPLRITPPLRTMHHHHTIRTPIRIMLRAISGHKGHLGEPVDELARAPLQPLHQCAGPLVGLPGAVAWRPRRLTVGIGGVQGVFGPRPPAHPPRRTGHRHLPDIAPAWRAQLAEPGHLPPSYVGRYHPAQRRCRRPSSTSQP